MGKDGNARFGQALDETAHPGPAFKLDGIGARLEAGNGIGHCEIVAALVAAKRQIGHHQRVLHGARHGRRGGKGLLHFHRQRGVIAEHRHAH